MGAACCRPIQDNNENQSKAIFPTSGSRSFNLQSLRSGRTPARRSGSHNSSSSLNRGGRFVRRLHSEYLRRSQRISTVQPQQQVAPVTADGHSNQASYEPSNILKNCNNKTASSDCKIETPPTSPKENKTSDSFIPPITDDDDFCPTCLEGYEKDNPKILTKCKHHYHLACILEWMERSNTCPICDQEMIIEEEVNKTTDVYWSGSEAGQDKT